MVDKVREQKELMKNIYEKDIIENKRIAIENDYQSTFSIDLSLYGEDIIQKDFQQLQEKLNNFEEDLHNIQVYKYNYQITSLVLFIVIAAFGISGYWIRREYIPLIASILLLFFAVPIIVAAGIETSYTFLSIDFCSTIGNSIISGITPSENTGLGTYLSCPSKETMRILSTAIYQYIVNFDSLYKHTKENLSLYESLVEINLENDKKRDNDYLREVQKNLTKTETKNLKKEIDAKESAIHAINVFININYILAGLLSMTSCLTAKNSINFIEENYCYENHDYMFYNMLFSLLAGISFIITAAGINKLIIVMRNRYSRALRGKKEFNTDIITEDDED